MSRSQLRAADLSDEQLDAVGSMLVRVIEAGENAGGYAVTLLSELNRERQERENMRGSAHGRLCWHIHVLLHCHRLVSQINDRGQFGGLLDHLARFIRTSSKSRDEEARFAAAESRR